MKISHLLKDLNIDNDTIVVGVSTGSDSMCLLHYLKENTDKTIICAHVNHQIRKESDEEEKFLEEYCKKNHIIFEKTKITNYQEKNFENEARKKRYAFYETLLHKYQTQYLFLAHHGDDLIETILMKIIRGSNIEGYSGFKKMSYNHYYYLVRPLINYTKKDILLYIKEHHIPYYEDYTNQDTKYQRNNIRQNILPLLKEIEPNIVPKFNKYGNTLNEYDEYIKRYTNNLLKEIYQNNKLNLQEFIQLDPFIKKNILYTILNNIYQNKPNNIKEEHIKNINNLINNQKHNISINLPNNIVAYKDYQFLIIKKTQNTSSNYQIKLEKTTKIKNIIIKQISDTLENGNNIAKFNSKNIKLPLYLRNYQANDYIHLLGSNYPKKVKEIFNENKISQEQKETYPILIDSNNEILWIPNLKKSKFNTLKNEFCDIILKYCEKEDNK